MEAELKRASALVAAHMNSVPQDLDLDHFQHALCAVLREHYRGHLYLNPLRGQAYRCLHTTWYNPHPWLVEALTKCSLTAPTTCEAQRMLPTNLTVWVDPGMVSYRVGDAANVEEELFNTTNNTMLDSYLTAFHSLLEPVASACPTFVDNMRVSWQHEDTASDYTTATDLTAASSALADEIDGDGHEEEKEDDLTDDGLPPSPTPMGLGVTRHQYNFTGLVNPTTLSTANPLMTTKTVISTPTPKQCTYYSVDNNAVASDHLGDVLDTLDVEKIEEFHPADVDVDVDIDDGSGTEKKKRRRRRRRRRRKNGDVILQSVDWDAMPPNSPQQDTGSPMHAATHLNHQFSHHHLAAQQHGPYQMQPEQHHHQQHQQQAFGYIMPAPKVAMATSPSYHVYGATPTHGYPAGHRWVSAAY
eukprot:m.245278 g.245278  ORF g.245278 m.245278 type:complete len:415 (+) comp15364_c1_seq2:405-1649(+)